jgi:microcin C transport system permease protein
MTAYFIRRFLLIIPTFLGITLVVFAVTNFVPGGPVERQIMRYRAAAMSEGGGGAGAAGTVTLAEDAIQEIRRYYGFDKPLHIRYAQWLWKVLHLDLGNSCIYRIRSGT